MSIATVEFMLVLAVIIPVFGIMAFALEKMLDRVIPDEEGVEYGEE